MQAVIDLATQRAAEATLKFYSTKMKVMIFTRKRNYTQPPKIVLNGQELQYSSYVKYLGLWLDHKLTRKYHIAEKLGQNCQKCTPYDQMWN